MSLDGRYIACGHTRGGIVLWSVQPVTILKAIPTFDDGSYHGKPKGHSAASVITAIAFSRLVPNEFMSSDSRVRFAFDLFLPFVIHFSRALSCIMFWSKH